MEIFLSTDYENYDCYAKTDIHPSGYIQDLTEAVWNDDPALFSNLIGNININEYYRDSFDEEGEGTLVSYVLLNLCFYSSNPKFLEEILLNKPNINLPTSIYSDGSPSFQTVKTWLQTLQADVQDEEDYAMDGYLAKIEKVMTALGIKSL